MNYKGRLTHKNKIMNRIVITKYGTTEIKFMRESYQSDHFPYQEIKTQWGNRKRKIIWNMKFKKEKNE